MKIGLDFGTTNSSLSLLEHDKVKLLSLDKYALDPAVIRSALYFYPRIFTVSKDATKEQLTTNTFRIDQVSYQGPVKTLFGSQAVSTYLADNKNRKPGIKRKIYTGKTFRVISWFDSYSGKTYLEDIEEVLEDIDYGTGRLFHALKTALKSPYYKGSTVFGDFFPLEKLIGLYLSDLKIKAESELNSTISEVTVGRPVHFSDREDIDHMAQSRLEEAVKLAGFKNIKFEFEPVGAAKYFLHVYGQKLPKAKVLVFDFGGGTLDTAIIEKNGDNYAVLATDGVYIGGDLLNSDIMFYKLGKYFGSELKWGDNQLGLPSNILESLKSWYSIPNLGSPETMETIDRARYKCSDEISLDRLIHLIKTNLGFEMYEAIEVAKKELSSANEAAIIFKDGPIDISERITREEFEELISPEIDETQEVVIRTMKNVNLSPQDITFVVATGGSSLLPIVKERLTELFGKEKVNFFETFTSIAAGLIL